MRVNAETDADAGYENYYFYDDYGQLIRENNEHYGKTILYTYDNIGNITKAQMYDHTTGNVSGTPTEDTYVYSTSYPDRLTSFNNKSITYDSNGCIKTYDGWNYTWHRGKLNRIEKSSSSGTGGVASISASTSYTFTYNAYGQRTEKEYKFFPGLTHLPDYMTSCTTTYVYDLNGRLCYEKRVSRYFDGAIITRHLIYLYENSEIVGIIYLNDGSGSPSALYYYDKNHRGDVVGILDSSGNTVVKYRYDAYGNCTSYNSTNDDLAQTNPIRYRSYYYDADTGLYYLNARYYNPQWRRFISPDNTAYLNPESVNGLNLYAYCNNDPVNYADPSGNSVIASLLIGFAISSLIGWGLSQMFGSQIAGGIGSISGGATAISTGISLCALGPWGIVAGVALIAIGGLTIAFGANEIVDGATGTNYIQDWTGWSDSVYNGVYTGLNIASAVGSIAGNVYLNAIRANALKGLDDAVYGPKASQHIGGRSYYDSKLTMREIVKYGKIRKAKYGVPGYEFRIKGYSVMGKSGNIHRGIWSLVYGKGVIWHFLLG